MKKITILLCCIAAVVSANAQSQTPASPPAQQQAAAEEFPHRYLAIGVRIAGIQGTDIISRIYPPNRLVINVDPIPNLRFEAQAGIFSQTQSTLSSSVKTHTKSSIIAGGLMGMYGRNRGRFTAGLRIGYNSYSD